MFTMSDVFDTDGQDEGNSNEYLQECEKMNFTDISINAERAIKRAENDLIFGIEDASTAAMALDVLSTIASRADEMAKNVKARINEWGKANDIKKADIGGGKMLVFGQDVKHRFDTDKIYKALDVPQYLIDILPANPAFKVSAVRLNEKIAHLTWDEVKDEVTVKPVITDKRYLK